MWDQKSKFKIKLPIYSQEPKYILNKFNFKDVSQNLKSNVKRINQEKSNFMRYKVKIWDETSGSLTESQDLIFKN